MKTIIDHKIIRATSSLYISSIEKREKWRIDRLDIDYKKLQGIVSIEELPRIVNHFHLSFFTAMEIASQLQIIFMHHYAKLNKKTEEVWMLESSFISKSKITKTQNLFVNMQAIKIRIIQNFLYCSATHQISEETGGLFEIKIKAIMKVPTK